MRDIEPAPGEERIETWFAWCPVYVDREMRWLERVTVRQIWCMNTEEWGFGYEWVNVEFR